MNDADLQDDPAPDLDLGGGYTARWVGWHPERDINPGLEHLPDVDRYALSFRHPDPRRPGEFHTSMVTLAGEVQAALQPDLPVWTVHSWDPLTLTPSILCTLGKGGCGVHGYITEGRWVPA